MDTNTKFDNIRPYRDSEVRGAIDRLAENEEFFGVFSKLWDGFTKEFFVEQTKNISTIQEFRDLIINPLFKKITDLTTCGITVDGLEYLDKDKSYLFISDHRDIILDSAILNLILASNGYKATENAIGSNLLLAPWIIDFVKLDSCFIIERDIPMKEFKDSSIQRAKYIRDRISTNASSVWIAQREGRTKDGDDRTQISLLKMLNLGGMGDFVENFKELNIVPLAISYEYEPCDLFKTSELYQKRHCEKYVKKPGEDFNSMLYGMTSDKERVHFTIGKPLTIVLDDLAELKSTPERYKALADIIDYRIHSNYKLWPDNYIAHDLLKGTEEHTDKYTEDEKEVFINNMQLKLNKIDGEEDVLCEIYLQIYANPVINRANLVKPVYF